MPNNQRADKTRANLRRGVLRLPHPHTVLVVQADATWCDGCGDPISAPEPASEVSFLRVPRLRFHMDCYDAWVTPEC